LGSKDVLLKTSQHDLRVCRAKVASSRVTTRKLENDLRTLKKRYESDKENSSSLTLRLKDAKEEARSALRKLKTATNGVDLQLELKINAQKEKAKLGVEK